MFLRALSKRLRNTERLGASTASRGSPFQALTTLWVKKCLLASSLDLPRGGFEPFPRVLSLDSRQESSAPPSPRPLLGERAESDEINPQPPSLQTRQTQSPGRTFQPRHRLGRLPLGAFEDLRSLLRRCAHHSSPGWFGCVWCPPRGCGLPSLLPPSTPRSLSAGHLTTRSSPNLDSCPAFRHPKCGIRHLDL